MNYKIVYNPMMDDHTSSLDKGINFLCSDGKLHIRLRDYDHEEVISGFINKLTYFVTYLFQRMPHPENVTNNIIEKFVKNDKSLSEFDSWLQSVFLLIGQKYKGLKISRNYRKIQTSYSTPIGSFLPGSCPLKDGLTYGETTFFGDSLGMIPLEEFLLNESIDLVITKEVSKNNYTKFVNKKKKVKKEKSLEYIPLF